MCWGREFRQMMSPFSTFSFSTCMSLMVSTWSKIDLILAISLTRTLYFSRMYSCGCDWNRARSTSLHVNKGRGIDWPRLMLLLLSTAISSLVRRSFTRSEAGGTA